MPDIVNAFGDNVFLNIAAILVAALVAATVVELILTRVVARLVARTRTQLDDRIIAAVRGPLFSSVLLLGVDQAWRRLSLSPGVERAGEAALMTLVVLLWAGAGFKIGSAVLASLAARGGEGRLVQARTQPVFEIGIKTLIVGGAAYGVLLAWRVDVTAWLASAGILGIAVGFAAKDTLANLFSGIFILADAPYKLGDYIVLDSGERGRVTDIGIRSTRLLTRDDVQIIVPNAAIASAKIVNESGGPYEKERVRVAVGVAYGSDVDQVRAVLLDVAARSEHLLDEPEPRVRFRAFGESSLDFELLGWIARPELRGRALDELNTAVYKAFAANAIQIPFPQRDVHLRQA